MGAQVLLAARDEFWPTPSRGRSKGVRQASVPTTLARGERDPICPPRYADGFRALIPHARPEPIPGAAHLPHVDHPRRTAKLVGGFLGGD